MSFHDRPAYLEEGPGWPRWLLSGYSASEFWHDLPATDKQLEALGRRGYDPPYGLTRGEAHHVLGLATSKQRRALERRGRWRRGMTLDEAREALDAIAREEGWPRRS